MIGIRPAMALVIAALLVAARGAPSCTPAAMPPSGPLPASVARADSAPRDSAPPLPSGLELLHLVPPGQPPLEVLDLDNLGKVRDAFNAASDRARVVLLLSPTCPHCLHGIDLLGKTLADSAGTPLRVLVVWMHVTHSDRQVPNSLVLAKFPDRRAIQWWDPYRLVAKLMARDFPPDSVREMADTTGVPPPLIWNFVAVWRPGVRWTDRLPMPDFSGHPIEDVIGPFRRALGERSRSARR